MTPCLENDTMLPMVFSTTSCAELERFITSTLCQQENLDIRQTRIWKSLIRQTGKPVGMIIRLEGPRLMRLQALWIEAENRILFYDSAGRRFAIVQLAESPELSQLCQS